VPQAQEADLPLQGQSKNFQMFIGLTTKVRKDCQSSCIWAIPPGYAVNKHSTCLNQACYLDPICMRHYEHNFEVPTAEDTMTDIKRRCDRIIFGISG
jgi:hypothetical protein